jgi:HD-GYP domain-containing protein (c-di-GMP phosphodiesterase class II)
MKRANEIARMPDASDMVQAMLDLMMEITQADYANYFQLDPDTDELVITHVRGDVESQHLIGLRLDRRQGLPGVTLCDIKVVVAGELLPELDWLNVVDPMGAAHRRNVINLPVMQKERTLGVIQLFNFEQAEIDLLMLLAERLAGEMDHHSNIATTRHSHQRLLTLVDILRKVSGTIDRNHLLHLVTESASRLVDAQRSTVFLVDPGTREMLYQVAYQSPETDAPPAPPSAKPRRSAANEPKTRPRGKLGEFSQFNRSAITVPLSSDSSGGKQTDGQQHVLGGLMVFNKQNANFQEEDARLMDILAQQASTNLQIAEMYENSGELFLGVIKALATAIDAKDPYTQGHSQCVSDYSVLIGRELGIDDTSINDLRIGSLFHDIGKIGIPDQILLKNGRLSEREYEFMKSHPRMGVNILSQVKMLEPSLPAILEHHERLDGSGYPAQLADRQISWMGRIVAVADVYHAMTSNRPYRMGYRPEEVLTYLKQHAGVQFDLECVLALEQVLARSRHGNPGSTGRLNFEPIL